MDNTKSKSFVDKSNPTYNQVGLFTYIVKKIIILISFILAIYGYILLSNINQNNQFEVFHYIKEMGSWAINSLFVVVFAGPVYKLLSDNVMIIKFNIHKILKFFLDIRPEMGFFMGMMAICHGVFIILSRLKTDLFQLPLDFAYIGTWAIWSGVIAFIITIPMFLTSNRWAIQKLGPAWFKIHSMITYLVVFGVFHSEIISAKDGQFEGVFTFIIIVCIYFYIKYLASQKTLLQSEVKN